MWICRVFHEGEADLDHRQQGGSLACATNVDISLFLCRVVPSSSSAIMPGK